MKGVRPGEVVREACLDASHRLEGDVQPPPESPILPWQGQEMKAGLGKPSGQPGFSLDSGG